MITKVNAFLTSVGNIFKTKEEALREEREAVLKKFMLKKEIKYSDYDVDMWGCYPSKRRSESIVHYVPDQETIKQFLDNYDDIMLKLKEVDKNKDT